MARKKCKGTRLEVFSGKQATLNRILLLLLERKNLTKYDAYLEVTRMKGLRHRTSKTVYRRMDALSQEGWITQKGTRPGKVQGDSILYELTLGGMVALELDKKNLEDFIKTAKDEHLAKLIELLRAKI